MLIIFDAIDILGNDFEQLFLLGGIVDLQVQFLSLFDQLLALSFQGRRLFLDSFIFLEITTRLTLVFKKCSNFSYPDELG